MNKLGRFGIRSLGISKISVTTILALVALASLILLAAPSVHAAGSASITTDQSDYAAGSTVTIYGSGFAYASSVTVTVNDPNSNATSWTVTSDATGAFATTYVLDHVEGYYLVTATDSFGNSASTTFFDPSTGEAANLDQCTNGAVKATPEPCIIGTVGGTNFANWVNGNSNAQKSHWRESDYIPYRVTITGLTAGSHNLVFQYDTVHGSTHAEDYLGSFDNTETTSSVATTFHANNNNPCVDKLPVGQCTPSVPTSSLVMTNPTLVNCGGSAGTPPVLGPATFAPTREFKAWGPSGLVLTSMSYVSQNVVSGTGQCSTTVQLNFNLASISGGTTVVIAWGGHIGCACDWGVGNSASAISGSPYHMALNTLDGASTGSQDRALAAGAVFFTPLISTTIKLSNGTAVTSVTSGTVVHDTATLTGASPFAGGSVTYNLYTTNTCTGSQVSSWPKTVSVTNSVVPDSATFTTTTGQFSFQAVYSGDSQDFGATSGCEPLSVGTNVPHITTSAQTPITLAPSTSPPVSATDTATITGGTSPTGNIVFKVWSNSACSGSPVFTSTPVTVSGDGSYTSPPFTPTSAGTYYWIAFYSGDLNNSPVSTACGDNGETLVVNPVAPPPLSLTTQVSPASIPLGGSASDTATLSGGFNPTGSITFQVFQGCSGGLGSGAAAFTDVVPVSGNGAYPSTAFTPSSAGVYYWVASYSGDGNNTGVTSPCGASGETLNVGTTLVKTDSCAAATTGKPFTCTASVTGGTPPYLVKWTMPAGCTASGTTGTTITVTCSVKGTYTISDNATDSSTPTHFTVFASTNVVVTPQPLVVTVTCDSGATAGKPFNCNVSASGGTGPYTGTGSHSVTEPTKGSKTETFTVTDANSLSATGSTTVSVAPQPLVVSVTCPTFGLTAGKPFSCNVSATGGTQPYTGTGTISRTEPTKGSKTETFTVTDSNGVSASGSASVTIAPQPLVVTVSCDTGATAGKPFDCSVTATGGTTPYSGTGTFSVTEPTKGVKTESFTVTDANGASASGSTGVNVTPQPLIVTVSCGSGQTAGKPFNCTVSATGGTSPYSGTGSFSVTQPVKGSFDEQFTVTDANGVSASGSTSVTVTPQPLVVTVNCGIGQTAGKPFSCTVSATGGTGPYTGTDTFSVTQPVKGTFTESFSVTDANHITASGSASVTVAPQPLVVTVTCGSASAAITAGKPFNCIVSATGGTGPYSGTGTFTLTEQVKGAFTESFSVTDANGVTASGSASVTVAPQPLVVTVTCGSSTAAITAGKPFDCTVSATGGTTPYSGTGTFSVTEQVKGTFTETFSVTDANGVTASGSTSVIVAPQPLVVTVTCGSETAAITAGKPFSCIVSATGGTTPYSGTGTFTLTEAVKGGFTETFSVADANGVTATGSASINVVPQPLVVTVSCGIGATAGKPFSCTVSATGGTTPYSGTGVFAVTEPVKGTFTESFSVTDANGVTASGSTSVTVAPQPLVVTVVCDIPGSDTAGKPFLCHVSATGGTQPYSGTGDFSVTEQVKGTYVESFSVTDANGVTATGSDTVVVAPQPLIVTVECGSGAPAITAGKPFNCIVSATGGTQPYSGTGTFTVTEAVKGGFTETFSVADANGVTATGSASINVVPQPLVVTVDCGAPGSVTAAKPFGCHVLATGGTEPYSGTGTFTVTEPVKGTFVESFSVTDANGVTASGSTSVTVAPQPLVVTVTCGSASASITAGKPFECTVSATGGTQPYSGTGTFSLTEQVKGGYTETFSVTDANGVTAIGSASVTVAPQPLVVTVSCDAGATAGKPFSCTVDATGGTQPYSGTGTFTLTEPVKGSFTESFSVTDANGVTASGSASVSVAPQPLVVTVTCPSGLTAGKPFTCTYSATGGTAPYTSSGTSFIAPSKGPYTVPIFVTDSNGVTALGTITVTIAPQPLVVTVTCDSAVTAGKPFNCDVSATGGTSPYSGTGSFSITESVKGTYTESFTVIDSNSVSASGSTTVIVTPQPLIVTVTCGSASSAITAGKPFDCTVSATGGTQPYSGTGTFTLTEQVKGGYTETFSVTDANGVTATGSASINVAPQPLVVTVTCGSTAPAITAGKPFNCTVSATGGTAPYTGTGSFSVTEQVKGAFTESFSVTDANGVTATGSASINVSPQPLVVTVTCDSGATAGKPFSCTVSATGGTSPYSGTGTFTVNEPVKGTFAESFSVTDANGVSASGSASVTVAPQPLVATVECFVPGRDTTGKPFNCTVSATGGTQPYSGTGTFSVTEQVKGTYTETFSVTDANGVTASGSTSVIVAPQPLVVTVTCGSETAAITAGKPFNCVVSATGGTTPYSGTGTFQVTEPVKGTFTESFSVTDANGVTASGSASVNVVPQPLVVTVTCGSSTAAITAGKPFNCTVSATGGTTPYSGTGTFSVTEQVKGTFTETFSVTDANGVTAAGSDIVIVTPQPLVVTVTCGSSAAAATAGKPFNCTVSATGGTQPYSGTGTFSVIEQVKGTYTESFSVTDANGVTASASASITVVPQPLVVTVGCLTTGPTAGKPFTCFVSATGGTAPYQGTGLVQRTEPVKGTFTESFSVTDANGVTATGSASVTIAPQPLVVTVTCGSSTTAVTAGKPFSCTVSATGGTEPYSGTGIFTVTEPVKGTFTETFSVADANGVTASGSASVSVAPQPLVVTVTCGTTGTSITAGKPFSCTVSATGGTEPYSGTGIFTITEPVKGTFTETFTVTDANGASASGSATVTIVPQPLVVTVGCLTTGPTAGKPFTCFVSATGGTAPYQGTGLVQRTEPVKGTFTESFSVTDANGVTASGSDIVTVAPQPLVVTVSCDTGATAGKPFNCTVSATGGTGPYSGTGTVSVTEPVKGQFTESFSVTDANGITASGSAVVSVAPQPLVVTVTCGSAGNSITAGKPFNCTVSATGGTQPYTGTGTFSVTESVKSVFTESFSVTDANGVTASGSASVTVVPQPLIVTVSCGSTAAPTSGKPFNCTVSATGGTGPYSGTGTFTVTQPVKGTFTETFNVTDANGVTATGTASVNVSPQPLVVTVNCGSGQTASKPFSCTVSASGGTAPYTGTGVFSVTQQVKGVFAETFTARDANGVSASGSAMVNVAPQPLVVTVGCGTGTAGKPFSCTVSATGGTSPYTGTGTFTVTQPVKGTFTESFTVTDANGASASGSTSVTVTAQPLVVTVTCPSSGLTAGKSFSCTVSATGGTAPYTGTGTFTVTQPVKGTFTERFTVNDSNGISASGSTTVTITAQPLVVTVTCPSTGVTSGKPFNCTVSTTGGTGPYSGTGTFSVTQPVKGSFTERFNVHDANGATASGSATVTVSAQPLIVSVTCQSGSTAGKPFTCTVSANGGTAPYAGTGTFTVVKQAKGTYSISYTVTDTNGVSAQGSATVTVQPQPLAANFTSTCSGSATLFTATVSGGTTPYSFSWNFGDSSTGTGNPVSHTYGTSGTFTVTLTVTDANGARTTVTKSASGCGQPVVVTDTSFCTLPNNNFVLIFITDPQSPSGYRLVSSNPGQFYDNVFYSAAPGSPVTLNIQVPYPFITNGAYPIQVSTGFSLTSQGCFAPNFANPSGFTITAPGPLSSSGHPTIVLSNYSPQNFGSTVTVTVTGTVPSTGLVYVTIHLDYGLKGTTGWLKGVAQGSSFQATNSGLGLSLNNGQSYAFSVSGSESFTTSVTSSNVFKKDPGIAGVVTDSLGNPIAGATIKVYDNNGMLLGITTTDQNGVYLYFYKYTGTKSVNFTIKVITPTGATQTALVPMQSNKLVLQNFVF